MATSLSRRALLRGRITGSAPTIRPPWAILETAFLSRCNRCGDCVKACRESIIHTGDGGYPTIDFSKGECTFCGDCASACKSGALSQTAMQASQPAWQLSLSIKDNCLALNRVICRSCAEQCEQQAIRFRPAPGGISRPELNNQLCNGCGACIAPCPVAAIELNSLPHSANPGEQQQENKQ